MSKRRHNFGTKRFKRKIPFYISCPYRAEVADTAVCTPDCARCQNRENIHTDRQTHRQESTVTLAHARRGLTSTVTLAHARRWLMNEPSHGLAIAWYTTVVTFVIAYNFTNGISTPLHDNKIIGV